MEKKVFLEKLKDIVVRYNDEITELVHKAQEDEFGEQGWNTSKELPYFDDWDIDDCISNIIGHGAWVYDRIRGIKRTHRKSLQKKVRKLLGFTNP